MTLLESESKCEAALMDAATWARRFVVLAERNGPIEEVEAAARIALGALSAWMILDAQALAEAKRLAG